VSRLTDEITDTGSAQVGELSTRSSAGADEMLQSVQDFEGVTKKVRSGTWGEPFDTVSV
jgi:hypothetical protein